VIPLLAEEGSGVVPAIPLLAEEGSGVVPASRQTPPSQNLCATWGRHDEMTKGSPSSCTGRRG